MGSKGTIGKTLQEYYKKVEDNKETLSKEDKSKGETNKDAIKALSIKEEPKIQQTGKLKLKLKMEEGKVVSVDDSGLLPDEPDAKRRDDGKGRRSPDSNRKSESRKLESKKSPKDGEERKHKDKESRKSKKDGELNEKKHHKKLESKKSPKDDECQEKKHHKEIESKKSSNERADEKIATKLKVKESPKEDSACDNLKSKS